MKPIRLMLLLGFAAVAGWWFFGFYDTAIGKCNRGDLGACTVAAAQHQAEASQRAADEYARQKAADAIRSERQDPSIIRCDVLDACAQDVTPFPLAPAGGGTDWCFRWTDESHWRYGGSFLALDSEMQQAVRAYCERGETPPRLPAAP